MASTPQKPFCSLSAGSTDSRNRARTSLTLVLTVSISSCVTRAYTSHLRNHLVYDSTVEHADDAVRPPSDGDVMGRDHKREAALLVEAAHQVDDFLGVLAV